MYVARVKGWCRERNEEVVIYLFAFASIMTLLALFQVDFHVELHVKKIDFEV